ncbi:TPM domain-containing protein [Paracoccus spongiarum]|uniref:TPM domain-containing protein n=1 Tax=Paracoccus spongiarum TaxID=3064387 RepID=A0ABT9J6S2_9RHOB|nr:TPM domain-containing protein [Paracoccus sp. 2205BS29-5]MDP5305486.1 TPM domain-containing protein [Paracoccus sp. 2205BS29-5]
MIRAALIWLALALPLAAQDLPDWQHTSINDMAGLLAPEDVQRLDSALIALFEATDIEGTVVTLPDRARFGGNDGLEPFATRLFNRWGVGDRRRNDGFMVLVLAADREVRIELGAGYPAAADAVARDIIDRDMLPDFRAGRLSQGIRKGTEAVIARIARPAAEGRGPDAPRGNLVGRILPYLVFGFFGFVAAKIGAGIVGRIRHGRRPCPNCGGRGLVEEIAPLDATDAEGRPLARQSVWTRCPACGWSRHETRDAPQRSRRTRGGGFGGGRSSGGGASGRW